MNRAGVDPELAALRGELIERAAVDQRARAELDPVAPMPEQWEAVQRVDEDNVRWFAPIVAVHGWPGRRTVGVDGAHAAWVLAQHAPAPYRACWLPKLRAAVANRDAAPRDLAFLSDRVATDQQRPQHYGTQWLRLGTEAAGRLYPLRRPAEVNLARADVGLDPLPDSAIEAAYSSFTEITAATRGGSP
ncbi:hypothetical protein SacmaDRAFT_4183 [Saccharomonospora marina XMU15]|uniref:Uncharacterized protein n=1 Tax=Saccharomonospora marina XMU15 TaxID=882083 RepID=H5X6U7_9PSEU|nr:DUF6624 domain-containing protein [Saccharomonospora marina]EHR52376.1 hypothetical protein SacmaDRAFT_4183 [Saccharomonospora marina XMU15]